VTLLHAAGLGLSFGSRTIFDGLTLTIEEPFFDVVIESKEEKPHDRA
jgi:hypothetical protein